MSIVSRLLLILSLSVFSLGLIMVYNTTSGELLDRMHEFGLIDSLLKQGAYGILGCFVGFIVFHVGHKKWIEYAPVIFGIFCVMLLLVFIPKIGCTINGAKRWIKLFGLTFQPSEIMKILVPLFYVWYLNQKKDFNSFKRFMEVLLILAFPVLCILIEPDNGTALILTSTIIVLLFLSRVPFKFWLLPIMIFISFAGIIASKMPHVQNRIQVYLDPETDILGKGHQPYQAKIAAGSGGLHGKGLGQSLQKYNYLPEARSDYILAIFAEEFGLIGIVALIFIYMWIVILGFIVAMRTVDKGSFLLASSLSYVFAIQAFLNMGIVSGLLPSKGTSLPLMSQGGSSLIANAILICLLIQIEEVRCRGDNKLHLA
ncbi:MAG: cell division protein FtsW [Chlamydiae bacterium]|nr:cell division protein FtsW [Chlamydiota bacterium]